MDKINEMSVWIQGLIASGIVFRIVYCCIRLQGADEEASRYKKRIIHALIFLVLSQLAFVIKNLITGYYK